MRHLTRRLLALVAVAGCAAGAAMTVRAAMSAPAPVTGSRHDARSSGELTEPANDDPAHRRCPASRTLAKRELRGVWIATTQNLDWPSDPDSPPAQQQAEAVRLLDAAQRMRLNAVFLQVRPSADAFYRSRYEPWSAWLAGRQGRDPGWDPLEFFIDQAHRRGIELHAWFNPYRVAYHGDSSRLAAGHPARQHPDWLVRYGGKLYFNPGLPETRAHIVEVVLDVARRYDIDGVHFDDYFYPYPVAGARFGDTAAYLRYGRGSNLADWRRANVNALVSEVSRRLRQAKPWVSFGISPFGIWRNSGVDRSGSATRGLSAFDEIYADSRTWIRRGWIDYVVPQLYWTMSNPVARYDRLVRWWAREVGGSPVRLAIGQAMYQVGGAADVRWRDPSELPAHLAFNRRFPEVTGDVFFSARDLERNRLGVTTAIARQFYSRPALPPTMPRLSGRTLPPVRGLTASRHQGTVRLRWQPVRDARWYAVHRTPPGGDPRCATTDGRHLIAVIPASSHPAYTETSARSDRSAYYVTAVDGGRYESKPARTLG